MKKLKVFIAAIIAVYAMVCVYMFTFQRNFLYIPTVGTDSPAQYGLVDFRAVNLHADDGTALQAWYHPAKENHPTIIYFHGNAGNLSHRVNYFSLLRDAGFGIVGLDYRGYGNSEGIASENGFYMDARAAMDFAIKTLRLPENKIIIYGESIGTGVAVQMATEFSVGGLILQSPFSSMSSAASYHFTWLPVRLLLRDKFDSISKIKSVRTPLLLFHGENDRTVPIASGKELFDAASAPKQSIYFPGTGHNDFDLQKLTNSVLEFSKDYKLDN